MDKPFEHGIYSGIGGYRELGSKGIGTTGPQPPPGASREIWLHNCPWLRDLVEGRAKITPYRGRQDPPAA